MNKRCMHTLWLVCAMFLAQEAVLAEVKGRVRVSLDKEGTAWVGEQIQVNLDLMTTGYRFSDIQFNLPEVDGAFIMQTDSTTIKLTESMNEQIWQVVRYPLSVFPQKNGTIQIPPVKVRFISASTFGSLPRQFDLQTSTLQFSTRMPPGADADHIVVTTREFDLKYEWSPALNYYEVSHRSDENSTSEAVSQYVAKPGDAITLTVIRRAEAISGMLLTPIPIFEADGLSVYPKTAKVEDKVNRSSLTGVRSDEFTWVVEKAGQYVWPDIRFQWWDPSSEQLKSKMVTGFTLNVAAQAPSTNSVGQVSTAKQQRISKSALILLVVLVLLGLFWKWKSDLLRQKIEKYRTRKNHGEKLSFKRLQAACKQGSPAEAYCAINAWFNDINGTAQSISTFAAQCEDDQLSMLWNQLQLAVVDRDQEWDGGELSRTLAKERKKRLKKTHDQDVASLPNLNPGQGAARG